MFRSGQIVRIPSGIPDRVIRSIYLRKNNCDKSVAPPPFYRIIHADSCSWKLNDLFAQQRYGVSFAHKGNQTPVAFSVSNRANPTEEFLAAAVRSTSARFASVPVKILLFSCGLSGAGSNARETHQNLKIQLQKNRYNSIGYICRVEIIAS